MHHPSVSRHIIPLKFSNWNTVCFGQKEAIKVQFFRLLSALMKVHPIPHVIFETASPGFIQILCHCSVSWKTNPLYFFSSYLMYFGQKEPIKITFSDFWEVGWKFIKFLMSYLKPQVSFSLNFPLLFSVMRDNSSVLFKLKLYMIWPYGANQSAKFQTFDCWLEISPSLYFDRLPLLKVYKISIKKVQRSYISWHNNDTKFEEKLTYGLKNDMRNLANFLRSTQKSQN